MLVWYVSQAVHGCHASRAEPGLTPLTRETDPRPSILSTFYCVTMHGCHTSRAEPGLTPLTQGIGPRPSILFMCRTYYVGVIPCHISRAEPGLAPLTRGSDPRPSILSMCYCVTMHGCHNMLYQKSGTRARTTHPRIRSSTIDSLYVFCVTVHWCHTMSYQQSRTRAHTTHPRNRPSILSGVVPVHGCHSMSYQQSGTRARNIHSREPIIDHRFSLCVSVSQCMGVIPCHTSRVEPGLTTLTRGTDP